MIGRGDRQADLGFDPRRGGGKPHRRAGDEDRIDARGLLDRGDAGFDRFGRDAGDDAVIFFVEGAEDRDLEAAGANIIGDDAVDVGAIGGEHADALGAEARGRPRRRR